MSLKIHRCGDCGKRIVILQTQRSCLPVEVPETGIINFEENETFDSSKHKSHLLYCKGMQKRWPDIKKKFNA